MTLLLSHSQQLLNSQNQAYANLLCWRPPNLFNRLRSREEEKRIPNVERGCFFSLIPFCFRETTLYATIPCLPHIKTTISHFLSSSLCFVPSCMSSPHTLPLPPGLSLWSVLQCLTQPLCWPQIQIQIQLHWHDKRGSSPGFFSKPGLPQSALPWPSNLCFSLECSLYDPEEGQPSLYIGSQLWTATL